MSGGNIMKRWTEKDIENLLKNSAFPNSAHKRALREQLFEPAIELSLDDLKAAAGGVTLPDPESWTQWQMSAEDKK